MKKILLIDDDENFKLLFETLLHNHSKKYELLLADNPVMGLDLFYKHHKNIAIVLCDFFLPVQNGDELLEIIKEQNPITKCILISGDEAISENKFDFVDETFSKQSVKELINYLNQEEDRHL